MLIPVTDLVNAHGLTDVTGILHLGAHHGEEADAYDRDIPWTADRNIVWVEGNPAMIRTLNKHVGRRRGHTIVEALIDDHIHDVTFHVASNGESSSVLELGTHATEHPEVTYIDEFTGTTTTVDAIGPHPGLNFLNIDLQGLELRALKGAADYLKSCDYIYTEVNRRPLYIGCPMIDEIDQYLPDFTRAATLWTQHHWGDAFYVRTNR